ncbi:MAG: hypothetical protein AAFV53_25210 [Myxococcota bacterium]
MLPGERIAHTASVFEQIAVGQRLWFHFLPGADLDDARLMVTTLGEDPSRQSLDAMCASPPETEDGRALRGLAYINAEGLVELGGAALDRADLDALAEWVTYHQEVHASLQRLRHARLIVIPSTGQIQMSLDAPEIWADVLPGAPVPGSIAHSRLRLSRLSDGERVVFWATDCGAQDQPQIAILSEAEGGMARLVDVAEALGAGGAEIKGTLQRASSGRTVLMSPDDLQQVQAVIARLVIAAPLAVGGALNDPILVRSNDRGVAETRADVVFNDLRFAMKTLATLKRDESAWFIFSEQYEDNEKMMFVHRDRKALKGAHKRARSSGAPFVAGQVKRKGDNVLIFSASDDYADFVEVMVGWVREQRLWRPELRALRGARFMVRGEDGAPVRREKNDDGWNALFKEIAR